MIKRQYKYILLLLTILISCQNDIETGNLESKIVASINNENIYIEEIDEDLNKKLYDVLYHIYQMRKSKLDEKIGTKLITNEALKNKMSISKFLDSKLSKDITEQNLEVYAESHHYNINGIPEINNTFENVPVNSIRGQILLKQNYREFLIKNYIDSLRKVNNITIKLKPPTKPSVDVSNLKAYFKGNQKSNVTMWILSDLECNVCRKAKATHDKIFEKFKNKIRYAFVYYSGGLTMSSIGLEAANRQGQFWTMYDSLSVLNESPKQVDLIAIAKNINLNINKFESDIKDSVLYMSILENFKKINDKGFYGTPTVIINNVEISDAFSETEIEKVIKNELFKNN